MGARLLVVDDDSWILKMVKTVFERRGYEIGTATDGAGALRKAIASPPDLVITDVMMPEMDGWTLIKALRSHPGFAFMPVIFLTALNSDEDRIRGFRLGADDYLPKPFRFEELELRVAGALRRRAQLEASTMEQAKAPEPKDGPAIHGTLDQLGLPSLLTILEMERKSGVLVLAGAGAKREKARIFLRSGRVVRARVDGRPSPQNQEAVYELLRWAAGTFEFSALEVEMDDEVNASTTQLLMEGARLIDEASR